MSLISASPNYPTTDNIYFLNNYERHNDASILAHMENFMENAKQWTTRTSRDGMLQLDHIITMFSNGIIVTTDQHEICDNIQDGIVNWLCILARNNRYKHIAAPLYTIYAPDILLRKNRSAEGPDGKLYNDNASFIAAAEKAFGELLSNQWAQNDIKKLFTKLLPRIATRNGVTLERYSEGGDIEVRDSKNQSINMWYVLKYLKKKINEVKEENDTIQRRYIYLSNINEPQKTKLLEAVRKQINSNITSIDISKDDAIVIKVTLTTPTDAFSLKVSQVNTHPIDLSERQIELLAIINKEAEWDHYLWESNL